MDAGPAVEGRADQLGTGEMLVMTQSLACPVMTGRVPATIAILGLTGSVGSVTCNVSGPVCWIAGWLLKPLAQARTTSAGEASHGWSTFSKAVWDCQNCRQLVMSQMPGNVGSVRCGNSITTRLGWVRVKAR